MRFGLSVSYAILAVAVSYAPLVAAVEVAYPDKVAVASERKLGFTVDYATQAKASVVVPVLGCAAEIASYLADYGVQATYSAPVAKVGVGAHVARAAVEYFDSGAAAAGGSIALAQPRATDLLVEPATTQLELDYIVPIVSLIETALAFPLEFFDSVVLTDSLVNVRDLSPADGTSLVDTLSFDLGHVLAESSAPVEDHVVDLDHPLPGDSVDAIDFINVQLLALYSVALDESVDALDDVSFTFVWSLALGSPPTSTINGAAFNEWEFNAADVGDWVYITDVQPLMHPNKALADSVSSSEVIGPYVVGKVLSDAVVPSEALVFNYAKVLADSVTASESIDIGFNFTYPIHEAFTSALHGHGMAFNVYAFNESNVGDGLMPFDVLSAAFVKTLTDSITTSEALTPFVVGKVLTDSTAPTDALVKSLTKPLTNSATSSEAINSRNVGKVLAESQSVAEALVKNIVPTGLTNSATTSDLVEIEHIVPVLVLLNQAPFNEVPFN